MMDNQQEQLDRFAVHADDIRESFKLAFESVKHLTTLSAGSLALFATFLDRIFPQQYRDLDNEVKVLIGVSFACFILTLVLSALSMWRIAGLVRSRRAYDKKKRRIRWNILLPSMCYILGLSLFGTAVLLDVFFGKQGIGPEDPGRYFMYGALILAICAAAAWVGYRVYRGNKRDIEGKYEVMYPGVSDYDELVAKEKPGEAFETLRKQLRDEKRPEDGLVTQQHRNGSAEIETLRVRQQVYAELLSLTHPHKLAVIGSHVSVDFFDFRDAVNKLEAQILLVSSPDVTRAARTMVGSFVDCIVAKEQELRKVEERKEKERRNEPVSPEHIRHIRLCTVVFNRKFKNLSRARSKFLAATQKDLNQKASRLSLVQSIFGSARLGGSG